MSVPRKNTTWGELTYEGKTYGVLYAPISEELTTRIERYRKEAEPLRYIGMPWRRKKEWSIEGGRLYLTKLYSEAFHRAVFGSDEKVFADWVDKMKVLVEDRHLCKTYRRKGSYMGELRSLEMSFDKGVLIEVSRNYEYYSGIDMIDYAQRCYYLSTLCVAMPDLEAFLDEGERPTYDLIWPSVEDFIETLISGEEGSTISRAKIRRVARRGERVVFASIRGKRVEELLEILVVSVTERIFPVKGYALRITTGPERHDALCQEVMQTLDRKITTIPRVETAFAKRIDGELESDAFIVQIMACL